MLVSQNDISIIEEEYEWLNRLRKLSRQGETRFHSFLKTKKQVEISTCFFIYINRYPPSSAEK